MSIVTRFPPSPTGYLHIGGARTALFNWLYARSNQGQMVLRIEDTDLERSTPEAVEVILEGMKWMGLDWDSGPFYQTKRFDRYEEIIQRLLKEARAYHCFCSRERLDELRESQRQAGEKPRYDHHCRDLDRQPEEGVPSVVRFRNPLEGSVVFDDVVRGRVEYSNGELDDLIIKRTDGSPTYNLTVVVDDVDMSITHVVRGDDHTNNTPRQINIFRALGATPPQFAHVPLILGPDGQRLSKRHGAVSVLEYREMGILPEALLNYLVRLGWSHGDQEIFSIDEMIELFDITHINKAPASFDIDKLLWVNQHYIKTVDAERLGEELGWRLEARGVDLDAGPTPAAVADAMRERATTLVEMVDRSLYMYQDFDGYEQAAADKHLVKAASAPLVALRTALESLGSWTRGEIDQAIKSVVKALEIKFPALALPLRVAISGDAATPSIDVTVELVGRERTLARISAALEHIDGINA